MSEWLTKFTEPRSTWRLGIIVGAIVVADLVHVGASDCAPPGHYDRPT